MAEIVSIREAGRIRLERALSQVPPHPLPDELQPFHKASSVERGRRVRSTLVEGYAIWRRGGLSIIEAVREAGGAAATGEYSLREMRLCLCELNIDAWERHPFRTRDEVRKLFRKTIARLMPHRGGWVTSRGHCH